MTHTIRRIAGVLGIATAALAMMASPAGASGETIGSCAIDEAIEAEERLAADGIAFHNLHDEELEAEFATLEKAMEGCLEAPSPIIPELDEIIWGGGAFLVLFGFMVWKGFPAVQGAMDARADKIAADLDAADKAMSDAAKIKSDHAAELAGAKAEASELIKHEAKLICFVLICKAGQRPMSQKCALVRRPTSIPAGPRPSRTFDPRFQRLRSALPKP